MCIYVYIYILPGRGAMVGEFVLFQYLLHRPRQSLAEWTHSNVIVLLGFL